MRHNDIMCRTRSPGIQLVANGRAVNGVTATRIRSTGYFGADCFEVSLVPGRDAAFWAQVSSIDIDIRLRLDGNSPYLSIIQGGVDSVRFDAISGIVQLEGRDYSAALIDAVVSESYSNRTASEIATVLANRHGLCPAVSSTTTIVGRYYQNGHDTVLLDTFCGRLSEWDLLCFLAQREGYDLFVSGTTLNFRPAPKLSTPQMVLTRGDLISLRMEHRLPLASDVEVLVKTWNSLDHAADIQSARQVGQSASGPGRTTGTVPRRYIIVHPNLTSDAAQQLAQRRVVELCRHRSSIELAMPGELNLMPREIVQLRGTGTDFDQAYRIDVVDRRVSTTAGFIQHIQASSLIASAPLS